MFRNEGQVRENILKAGVKNCYISEITIAELYFGVAKAADKARKMNDIKLKAGNTPYSPMGLRVTRCPGRRCVFIGHKWSRQYYEGEILIGQREYVTFGDEEKNRDFSFIGNEEETFKQLDKLVYEAYAKGEDFILEIDNSQVNDCTINRN